ncbi:oxidoreductase [Aspergillus karnatakaensis]|uniref:oxidoreductase n=1 Tax=Aspergillus karnatakaensis TaxID=1810916 RepID=UPI003CCD9492
MTASHELEASSATPATRHTQDLFKLGERTVIVTGGVGFLGLELSRAILESGGDVICIDCVDTPPTAPWETLQQLAKLSAANLWYYQCDITDADSTRTTFQKAISQARYPLRGLVACAGICTIGPSSDFLISEWKRIVDVNLLGVFVSAQAAANIIAEQDQPASIVFIASMSGYVVNKGIDCAAYNCSKAAVHQLTRSLAAEWGSRKGSPQIRVNSISPGYIRTRMTEGLLNDPVQEPLMSGGSMLGRVSNPDEYRGPAVFLLSDASSFVTGADLLVDGGYTGW